MSTNDGINQMRNTCYKDVRDRWYISGSPKNVITDNQSNSNTALDTSRFKNRFQSLTDNVRIVDDNTEGKIYTCNSN